MPSRFTSKLLRPASALLLLPPASGLMLLVPAGCERDAAAPAAAIRSQTPKLLDLGTSQQFAEIVSATGLDGPDARVVAEHTRTTALRHCRAAATYEGRDPDDPGYIGPCVEAAQSRQPQLHVARADCVRGLITVPWRVEFSASGPTYRLGGYDAARHEYRWLDPQTGIELPVGSASFHSSVGSNFEELCPATVAALQTGSRTFERGNLRDR
jgi:hypothetical protein